VSTDCPPHDGKDDEGLIDADVDLTLGAPADCPPDDGKHDEGLINADVDVDVDLGECEACCDACDAAGVACRGAAAVLDGCTGLVGCIVS
jgi:hypothetical protein